MTSKVYFLGPWPLWMAVFLWGCPKQQVEQPPTASSPESTQQQAAQQAAPDPRDNMLPAPADVANPPADAEKSSSGLTWRILQPGSGKERPSEFDEVEMHYSVWQKDGKMVDSSVTRGSPARFTPGQTIPGMKEGLLLMTAGEKRRFWVPAKLAYGEAPPGHAPKGDLVFDVELLKIVVKPPPPAAPADVAQAPKDAKKTPSGLAYKLLSGGKGGAKPSATSQVEVHYTGWTTDGKMFDSSVTRGQTATFPLNGVIKGWTEGLQLMAVGDKMRFWIPKELAYNDAPNAPAGMLVFDVELIAIR